MDQINDGVKRNMTTVIAVVATCLLIFLPNLSVSASRLAETPTEGVQSRPQPARPLTLPEAIKRVRPAVVLIKVSVLSPPAAGKQPQLVINTGTGFFLNDNAYLVTANHVINPDPPPGVSKAEMKRLSVHAYMDVTETDASGTNVKGLFKGGECEVIEEDERHDLALLRMVRNPFKGEIKKSTPSGEKPLKYMPKAPVLLLDKPEEGAAIAVSGYPLEIPTLISTSGWLASQSVLDLGPMLRREAKFVPVDDVYMADITINVGNSGGPAYLVESGAVIGLCHASRVVPIRDHPGRIVEYNTGLSMIMPSHYIVELAKKHNVKVELAK